MNKFYLLMLAFTLIGGGRALAQTDVTSTYIDNANFDTGTPVSGIVVTYAKDKKANNTDRASLQEVDSWKPSDTEDAKAGGLYKYGSKADLGSKGNTVPEADETHTGNALGIVAVWDAKAQYTQEAKQTLAAGTYTLTVDVYNQAGSVAPTKSLIGFISDAGDEYLAPASAYTVGSWQTVTYTFVLNEATKGKFSLGMTSAHTGSGSSPHFFFDNLKLISGNAELDANTKKVEGATPENPVVTDFVKNGTFDSNVNSWSSTTNAQNRGTAHNQTGAFTGNFYENWNASAFKGKMYQQVKNIPNGTYKLKICAFVSTLDAANQHVYANSDKVALTAGEPTAYEVWTVVTDNTAEVGLEQTAASANWMGIDNISLTYYGEGDVREAAQAAAHKTDYEAAKKEATAALEAKTYAAITGSERTALQDAVNATVTDETADGYDAAKSKITTAQSAFESALSHYTAYNNIKAQATTTTELPYGSKTKFDALTDLVNTETDPTSADDADSKVTAITKAIRAYVESNSVAEGVTGATSCTTSITNPNAEAADGWTLAQYDGGSNIEVRTYAKHPNDPLIDSNGSSKYNYFDGGNWSGKDWTTKYQQVVKNLPAGKYLLAVSARGSKDLRWYRLYANDVTADLAHVDADANAGVFGRGWNDGYIVFTTNGGDVTFGVSANAQKQHQWQSFTRFRLTRIGDLDAVTISEDATEAPAATKDYVNVTLKRSFNQNAWNTLVLPFDVTAGQVTSVFGRDTKVANFTGASTDTNGDYTLAFKTSTEGIKANTPVFIYGVSNTSFTFNGVKVAPSKSLTVNNNDVVFTGFYTPTTATAGSFFISSDNKFYKAIGTETIKATRAVFTLPSSSSAKIASIQMDGTATGITAVNSNAKVDNTVYNVAGQRVNNSYKGLVIVNGKKVLRK